ncbi:ABC1 family-domain-containing protein [Tribonema minus]|uniref:ABC1 family-domain-containing protein n=1 Tax=Tribonema minus TaxID=303371 RepID=A0A835YPW4_9STRA|nr:ABC1 family-domain-containing protein [Tribonema minus]
MGHNTPSASSSLRMSSADVIDVEVITENDDPIRGAASRRSPRKQGNVLGRDPEVLQAEIQRLAEDIVGVARDAGGRVGVARTLKAVQAVLTTTRDVLRDRAASGKPLSEGLKDLSTADTAKYLRLLFERMGATYVKLGQFIASSPTLFPGEFVMEMQKCLDSTEPIPFSTVIRIIRRELGGDAVSSAFLYIDDKPMASASIAQVHRAKLATGEEVVIKVQKPGAEGVLQADLGFLFIASRVVELLQPELARTSFSNIVGDIRASMLDELDFGKEADNIDEFLQFLSDADVTQATAPRVYRSLSTRRVLTMERLKGVPLTDIEGIRRYSANPEATLINALNTWSLSVMMCNSFHADVHAGNLLVLEDGRVGFIDFGIVGRIPKRVWGAVRDLSAGVVAGDYRAMALALVQMGATDGVVDIDAFALDIEGIFLRLARMDRDVQVAPMADPVTGRVGVAASLNFQQEDVTKLLIDIAATAENNGLRLPREFGLLIKQALYFDAYSQLLAPTVDLLRDDRIILPDSDYSPRT